jgi:TatA/E family protein of Tat protein translocase
LVLTIAVILFGAGRLSEVGEAIGRNVREFRKEIRRSEEAARPQNGES